MNDSLELFLRWFWASAALFLLYAALLVFKLRRRAAWLRVTSAEAEAWKRFGAPRPFANSIGRFGASKFSTICLGAITVLFGLLMVLNASAYLHFKTRLNQGHTAPASQTTHRAQ